MRSIIALAVYCAFPTDMAGQGIGSCPDHRGEVRLIAHEFGGHDFAGPKAANAPDWTTVGNYADR